jgi:hypothetical protein
MPVILITGEAETGRTVASPQSGQIVHETPISKITRAKWTGGVAQIVECLFCKHKVLNSTPIPTKKKKKKRKRERKRFKRA